MDIYERRRRNTLKLIEELCGKEGGQKAFVELTGRSQSQVSQLTTGIKDMGEKVARSIEKACGKPPYWLDNARHSSAGESAGKDFTKAKRGQFYAPDAQFNIPIYLDDDVRTYYDALAKAKGIELSELINERLKKAIENNVS